MNRPTLLVSLVCSLALGKPPTEFLAIGIIHKKTTGICSDSTLARWAVLRIEPDQFNNVYQQLGEALEGECPLGSKGGCGFPTRALVPANQVAIVVRFKKRWPSFNCVSNGLALFRGKDLGSVEAQLAKESQAGQWEDVVTTHRWPLPTVSAP